jgi:NIMA (never in mitosis gene a)-related kinase
MAINCLQTDRRTVAIKKVEIFDMAPKKRERCLQEVQLLQTLHHPSIISMLDSFIGDNMLIIVFEWALGGDLKRLIRRQMEQRMLLDESIIWGHFIQVKFQIFIGFLSSYLD